MKFKGFRLEEGQVESVKKICEELKMTQACFINLAIDNFINKLLTEKSGGMVLNIPNPTFENITETKRKEIIDFFNEVDYQYTKVAGGNCDVGLSEIRQFINKRLSANKFEKEKFSEEFYKFLEFKKISKGGGVDND